MIHAWRAAASSSSSIVSTAESTDCLSLRISLMVVASLVLLPPAVAMVKGIVFDVIVFVAACW